MNRLQIRLAYWRERRAVMKNTNLSNQEKLDYLAQSRADQSRALANKPSIWSRLFGLTPKPTPKVVSLGSMYMEPPEGYTVFDCRRLPDPIVVYGHAKNGLDKEVQDYVFKSPGAHEILASAKVAYERGENIAFMCMGGHHRSVSVAMRFAAETGATPTHLTIDRR